MRIQHHLLYIYILSQLMQPHLAFNINGNIKNLQNSVSSQAVATAVTQRFNTEVIIDNPIINEITTSHYHPQQDIVLFTIFVFTAYIQYKRMNSVDKKLTNVKLFSKIKNKTNMFFIIMTYVFTKNIDNVI